jgi:uncharacterized membrane protein
MMRLVVAYVATGIVFLGLDAVWLTLASKLLYRPLIGELLLPSFKLTPAAIFYALYIAGIVVFAVLPSLSSGRLSAAIFYGAALGLVAYGTYDLTNQATLKGWSSTITIADMIWGAAVTAAAAAAGALITRTILGSSLPS